MGCWPTMTCRLPTGSCHGDYSPTYNGDGTGTGNAIPTARRTILKSNGAIPRGNAVYSRRRSRRCYTEPSGLVRREIDLHLTLAENSKRVAVAADGPATDEHRRRVDGDTRYKLQVTRWLMEE